MNLAAQQKSRQHHYLAIGAAWAALLLVAVAAYLPGLGGPFVLDDFGAIAALGDLGGVRDWKTFNAYVLGGYAGPTGRPLALMTFLIDGNNWPTDPWPFKRTNLVIHLINGVLLGVLIRKILQLLQFESKPALWLALLSAACWTLHPFLVSTTLYPIQRMAQLSALFVIAGLIAYLYSRSLLTSNKPSAYLLMSLSVGGFTSLAVLSKENGALLPALVGVLEITVIASQRQRLPALDRYWAATFIVLPFMAIVLYLGSKLFGEQFFDVVPPRDFSLYERFLTQARVLFDYLQNWFIPKLYTTGIFQDHIIKSTGLFAPITTALTALFHVTVIAVAIVKRQKWPLFALAALFFYTSHLLESTVLNLELYFEHRNYLSASLLLLPVIATIWKHTPRHAFVVVVLCVTAMLAGFTHYSATIWKTFPGIVEASARKAPTSARAQAQYASLLYGAKQFDESLAVLDRAIENIPNNNELLLTKRITILCNLGRLEAREFERVAGLLSGAEYDPRSLEVYSSFSMAVIDRQCPDVTLDAVQRMYVEMLKVPLNGDPTTLQYSHVQFLAGHAYMYGGRPREALRAFENSLDSRPGASHAMAMAALMASSNYNEEALQLSERALSELKESEGSVSLGESVLLSDVREFQATVRADIESAQDGGTSGPDQ